MWELLKSILSKWGCKHQWELYQRMNMLPSSGGGLPHTITDTLICQECGKIKRIKL